MESIGWKLMMEVLQVFPGSISGCAKVLEEGDLLSIAPGGVREGSHSNYFFNSYHSS